MTNSMRVQNRVELENLIEAETKTKTTTEWLDVLEGTGMPYAAVNDIQGTVNHEHGRLTLQRICKMHLLKVALQCSPATWLRRSNIPPAVQ